MNRMVRGVGVLIAALMGVIANAQEYRPIAKFSVPGEGWWDYITVDSAARRLYVSHGDVIQVLNADSGQVLGQVAAPGAHGVALASDLQRGFTSNGKDKSVTIFDTKTLTAVKTVGLESGTDAILYDAFTKRVFPFNEKITALDARTGDVAGTVDLGGDPEAAVADGKGTVYVNLADKKSVAVVDAQALKVKTTYPIDDCTSPHSLSYDSANQRLLVGCRDAFVALDAATGRIVARTLICSGVDSSAFDFESKLIFESCGEGVMTVIKQVSPDYYQLYDTVKTQLYAGTMAFDAQTKKIFLPAAQLDVVPNTDPKVSSQFQMKVRPGSFTVVVLAK